MFSGLANALGDSIIALKYGKSQIFMLQYVTFKIAHLLF